MPKIIADVPSQLQPAANAALAWINENKGANYKLTGLVDPDLAWQAEDGSSTDMALVLCDNDACAREQVRIQVQGDTYQVAAIKAEDTFIPPHLDPPVAVRSNWLDNELRKHNFIVIVFYRGFW